MAVQKPKIEIPDPKLEAERFYKENILDIRKSFEFYNTIVIGIFLLGFVILLFTLATVLIQAWQTNSSYNRELSQIKIQEELIKNTIEQQKIILDNQKSQDQDLSKIKNYLGIE